MDIVRNAKYLRGIVSKHSPVLLSTMAVLGLIGTTVSAVKATPLALQLIEAERLRRINWEEDDISPITVLDTVKLTWRLYLAPAAMAVGTIGCILGAHTIQNRRIAAVTTLYTASKELSEKFKEKALEHLGESGMRKVNEELATERVLENPPDQAHIHLTDKGRVLFMESVTGRYFESEMEAVRKAMNDINHEINNDFYRSLNDWFTAVGLPVTKYGYDLGWNTDALIDLKFETMVFDGRPCIVIDYENAPSYLYDRFH